MGYKYFGYFVTVLILVVTAVGGWITVMVLKERTLLKKLGSPAHISDQEGED